MISFGRSGSPEYSEMDALKDAEMMNICMRLFGTIDAPGFSFNEISKAIPWNILMKKGNTVYIKLTSNAGNEYVLSSWEGQNWDLFLNGDEENSIETNGIRELTVYDQIGYFVEIDGKVVFQVTERTNQFTDITKSEIETIFSVILNKTYKIISEIGFAVSKRGQRVTPEGIDFEKVSTFYD